MEHVPTTAKDFQDNYLAMIVQVCLVIGVITTIVSGQSLIGASLPCEEADRDPDVNNPRNNLICPFTNETCITTSQICDCMNASGAGSDLGLVPGESDEDFVVHSIDCGK